MSASENASFSTSLRYDPRTAEQCLRNHYTSITSTKNTAFRNAVKNKPTMKTAFDGLLKSLEDWERHSHHEYDKGKRVIPPTGDGSDEFTLKSHSDFLTKARAFERDMTSRARKVLGWHSNPTWSACKCGPLDASKSSHTASQPAENNETRYVDEEEREVPESWEGAVSD